MGWMLAALVAVQGLVAGQSIPAETLTAPMPKEFKVGFTGAQGGQSIEERVPTGETVQNWTRMLTIQRFGGMAPMGTHALAERLGGMMAQACPGATVAPVVDGTDRTDGRVTATASLRVACPINPSTGKPETMIARAFQGTTDLHMAQYAWRSIPDAAQVAAATAWLASVRLGSA